MNKDKDNIIDFVKYLSSKQQAQNDYEHSSDKAKYIEKAVAELQRKAVIKAQEPLIKELLDTTVENTKQESLLNRWIFSLVNKRYPGLTIKLRNEQREFFAKQLKAMLAVVAVMLAWFEIIAPYVIREMDVVFMNYFIGGAGIVMYMMLGIVVFRISTRQGLLDLLQMHRVSQKKH